jgi:hypothetical protein
MSTGAWIFTGLVSAAVIAPTAVYAAVNSTVAIGTKTSSVTANVTQNRQLLTATVAPKDVIHINLYTPTTNGCSGGYTPPAGKAIVIMEVTYALGSGTAGLSRSAALETINCTNGYDWVETVQARETQSHVFPIGLPLPSVGLYNGGGGTVYADMTGYLIPATQLPAAAVVTQGPVPRR